MKLTLLFLVPVDGFEHYLQYVYLFCVYETGSSEIYYSKLGLPSLVPRFSVLNFSCGISVIFNQFLYLQEEVLKDELKNILCLLPYLLSANNISNPHILFSTFVFDTRLKFILYDCLS